MQTLDTDSATLRVAAPPRVVYDLVADVTRTPDLSPEIESCAWLVTESYEVTRPITRIGWLIIGTVFGCPDRRGDLRAGMRRTLERIREVAEREVTTAGPG